MKQKNSSLKTHKSSCPSLKETMIIGRRTAGGGALGFFALLLAGLWEAQGVEGVVPSDHTLLSNLVSPMGSIVWAVGASLLVQMELRYFWVELLVASVPNLTQPSPSPPTLPSLFCSAPLSACFKKDTWLKTKWLMSWLWASQQRVPTKTCAQVELQWAETPDSTSFSGEEANSHPWQTAAHTTHTTYRTLGGWPTTQMLAKIKRVSACIEKLQRKDSS